MREIYQELPAKVKETISLGAVTYHCLVKNSNYKYTFVENIDCSAFPAPIWNKESPAPIELDYIWKQLPDNKKPCLYFFEIIHPDTNGILEKYKAYKYNETAEHRSCAALKKEPPLNTKILYVGKVKDDIGGRMVVHFGYYYKVGTPGLQLVCWAKEIKLKLNLHIYSFDESMHDFVTPLELPLFYSMHPLIGKL